MKEIVELRAKTYSYLKSNNDKDKTTKGTKSVLQKENLNLKVIKTVYKQLKLKKINRLDKKQN